MFCENGVLKIFVKFTRKHLCQNLCLIKLQASHLQLFLKESLTKVFSCELCDIFINIFFYGTPLVAASFVSMVAGIFLSGKGEVCG